MEVSNRSVEQIVLLADTTSSKTGTLYFAYGSNLSSYQMSLRLTVDSRSSQPIGIARLDAYSWIICERGYANVVALPVSDAAQDSNTVWGVLYNLSPEDEAQLDKYEGHDEARNPHPVVNPDPQTQQVVPYLQGDWDYNKHYLSMTVVKWIEDPRKYGVEFEDWSPGRTNHNTSIRALVYVDELRRRPGKINQEYVGRMNRAIREGVQLGMPQDWVDHVLRKFIPPGIEVDAEDYVGTDEGYVETAAEVKKRE